MAALTNTQISVTYVGLLKTTGSTVLSSTAQQITDGSGNNSILYLSTAGVGIGGAAASGKELDVTGNVLVTGDLQVDNLNIDGNTISATSGVVTLANGAIATTQSASDNSTKIATTAYVDAQAGLADALSEVLAIGNTTGGTDIAVSANDDITFTSSSKAIFGPSTDLQIYSDGSNNYIDSTGNELRIRSNDLRLLNYGTAKYITADSGADVSLYHNDSKKLETTSTGVSVTGTKLSLEDSTADAAVQISFKNDAREWRTGVHGGINDSYTLYDNTAASTRLVVNSSGNVGISTTSPSQPFHCNGNALIAKLGIQSFNASFDLYNNGTTYLNGAVTTGANLTVTGALSKGSGSFKIEHPVKPDTHYLYHSFVESPLTDLIYRGKAKLVDGKALINIDEHFGMTSGTFEALVDDKQVFTTNEDSWDLVKGKVKGNELNIECQNKDFNGYISWLVIGDRKDKHIMEVDWTDERGKPKLEIKK